MSVKGANGVFSLCDGGCAGARESPDDPGVREVLPASPGPVGASRVPEVRRKRGCGLAPYYY